MIKKVIEDAELEAIGKKCQKLIASHKTLTLSTLSIEGNPEISYSPFILDDDGVFYIFVSELAHHTPNLLANSKCSILFAAPESDTKNLFARERAFFNCTVKEIPRGSTECDARLDAMQDVFGNTVELLRGLTDFHLFSLKPNHGQYTIGFGKAFTIHQDGSLSHIVIDKN
ncbi:pyridoxamine 5-phosphate oxidase [Endozoicomonas sp. (ex Bugula neritina AB1)]|nr:pyridoxamine 5-phosphate oxidase [Endozoicomonas sp. (ex Bugula neritina AB1)]